MKRLQMIYVLSVATFLLCLFLGGFGVHRFYVGKIGTAILQMLTLGGLGIWKIIDIIMLLCKKFTDAEGNNITYGKSKEEKALRKSKDKKEFRVHVYNIINGIKSKSHRINKVIGVLVILFLVPDILDVLKYLPDNIKFIIENIFQTRIVLVIITILLVGISIIKIFMMLTLTIPLFRNKTYIKKNVRIVLPTIIIIAVAILNWILREIRSVLFLYMGYEYYYTILETIIDFIKYNFFEIVLLTIGAVIDKKTTIEDDINEVL